MHFASLSVLYTTLLYSEWDNHNFCVLWGCRSVVSTNTHSELLPGTLGDLWLWVNDFVLVCGNPTGLNWSFFHLQKNLHHLLPSNHEGPQESDYLCSPQEYQLYMREFRLGNPLITSPSTCVSIYLQHPFKDYQPLLVPLAHCSYLHASTFLGGGTEAQY